MTQRHDPTVFENTRLCVWIASRTSHEHALLDQLKLVRCAALAGTLMVGQQGQHTWPGTWPERCERLAWFASNEACRRMVCYSSKESSSRSGMQSAHIAVWACSKQAELSLATPRAQRIAKAQRGKKHWLRWRKKRYAQAAQDWWLAERRHKKQAADKEYQRYCRERGPLRWWNFVTQRQLAGLPINKANIVPYGMTIAEFRKTRNNPKAKCHWTQHPGAYTCVWIKFNAAKLPRGFNSHVNKDWLGSHN